MTTLLATFALSMFLGLVFTPLFRMLGLKFNIVDRPAERKVHAQPLPRIGGAALYLAFVLTLLAGALYGTDVSRKITEDLSFQYCIAGATLVFLLGLADDIIRLRPWVKFLVQGSAASIGYLGGIRILHLAIPVGAPIDLGWLAFPATVFWFLLVINAINLIDGLDGLAAGVSLFVSLVLMVFCIRSARYEVALAFAALGGSCLGFLRYNFNPASIFMGDGGSYFLGYMLAGLSILASMKSQATVAMIIPIVALGLPLMDAILAPIRRFITGQELFLPDRSHIHHKLLSMGLTTRRAVFLMYGATVLCGLLALLMVNARDEQAGLGLFVLALTFFFGIRKLGYLEYLAVDKMLGYLHDVTDVMGLKRERRTFLNHQIAIDQARDADEMWDRVVAALELLRFDKASMCFNGDCASTQKNKKYSWHARDIQADGPETEFRILRMDLPLVNDRESYGTLHVYKDIMADPISHYTIRRIEHLRRSIVRKLKDFQEK